MPRLAFARSPVREDIDIAQNDATFVNDGRMQSSPISAVASELLTERMLPKHLAVPTEAKELSSSAMRINISGFRIAYDRSPTETHFHNVRVKDIEPMLPDGPTGVGIETDNALAQTFVRPNRADHEESPVHKNRGRAPTHRGLPEQILAILRPTRHDRFLA